MHRIWTGTACFLVALGLVELRHSPAAAENAAPAGPSIVWLVRHADKADNSDDAPVKKPQGEKRARDLATTLSDKNIVTIITSTKIRTVHTAKPLLDKLKKKGKKVATFQDDAVEDVVRKVKGSNGNVLVVHHSNTVPEIIKALGGPKLDELKVYYRLFTLDLAGKKTLCTETTYGVGPAPKKKSCQ